MNWPNLFVIGAPRCGTTTLYRMLDHHPDVFMSTNKEPWFYAVRNASKPFTGPGDGQGVRDRRAYGALFAGSESHQVVGEASTLYLQSREAVVGISEDVPEARLIAILRDPVERAHSNYLQHVWQGRETIPFGAALEAGPGRVASGWAPFWDYRKMGMYGSQLTGWLQRFPRSQLEVLMTEHLENDAEALFRDLCAFIGIKSVEVPREMSPANASAAPRVESVHRLIRVSGSVKSGVKRVLPSRVSRRLRRVLDQVNSAPAPPTDRAVAEALRADYQEDIALTEAITGRDLTAWKS